MIAQHQRGVGRIMGTVLTCMFPEVSAELAFAREPVSAYAAQMRLHSTVPDRVLPQVP